MQKYDIVNALVAKNKYTKYLEICTLTTGRRFSRIDQKPLHWRHRLLYCCPESFQDGDEITFRTKDQSIEHLLDAQSPYDLIFLDSFHTFECSLRDLQLALTLLRPAGTIVVHDCCPPSREVCTPAFRTGSWFGLSYCAYIEFVLSDPRLVYYTVDTDCGCGVIKRLLPGHTSGTGKNAEKNAGSRNELARLWSAERNQHHDMFDFFHQYQRELLNLISVKDFLALERIVLPRTTRWRQNLVALLETQ